MLRTYTCPIKVANYKHLLWSTLYQAQYCVHKCTQVCIHLYQIPAGKMWTISLILLGVHKPDFAVLNNLPLCTENCQQQDASSGHIR